MLFARLASASEPVAALDRVPTRQGLNRALRRGVTAPVTCGGPCRLRASLSLRGVVVATVSRRMSRAGVLTLHLRPRSRYRAALAAKRRVALRLRVRATDRGGRTRTTARTVNLRR